MTNCAVRLHELPKTDAIRFYLCPERKISFDGFVNYEGRRFGVPYSYSGKTAKISHSGDTLYIYSADLRLLLVMHNVTWSRKDSFCSAKDNTRILLNRRSSLRCRSRHKFSGFPSRKAIFPLPSLTLTRRIRYE